MKNEEIIKKALAILSKYSLCDACLGRQFALLGSWLSNKERGKSIKTIIFMGAYSISGIINYDALRHLCESGFEPAIKVVEANKLFTYQIEPCYICGDILTDGNIQKLVSKIIDKVKNFDFESFKIGCRIDSTILVREENLRSYFKLEYGESIKSDINREVGKLLQTKLKKTYVAESPDITIIIDFIKDEIELEIKPIYIYGRYRKLVRGIPQNIWFCSACKGRGCELCHNTGRMYSESIEEYIALPILNATKGTDYKFHGAGREDIDVRMLGNGRPFIIEVKNPKKRKIDLEALVKDINENANGKVEVLFLKYTDKKNVRRLKQLAEISTKTYKANVVFNKEIDAKKLRELENFFRNIVINQRTPRRVLHRRPDKVRKKTVFEVKAKKIGENEIEFLIKCQGGLYVKELITGDEGRTNPNFCDFLEAEVKSIMLDVVNIENLTDIAY